MAVFCAPMVAPPVGLLRVKLTVSSDSETVSLMIGIVTVLLVSPLAKLTVIELLIKSLGAVAVPLLAVKTTLTAPSLPPVRVIVTAVMGVPSSLTL
nr:hypothetical protein [Tolypothrix sp. PCC 7910]